MTKTKNLPGSKEDYEVYKNDCEEYGAIPVPFNQRWEEHWVRLIVNKIEEKYGQ